MKMRGKENDAKQITKKDYDKRWIINEYVKE